MSKIRVPILDAHAKPSRLVMFNLLQIIPLIGITLFVGFALGRGIFTPNIDPRMQVGATLESTQNTGDNENPLAENEIPKAALVGKDDTTLANDAAILKKEVTQAPLFLPLPESLLRNNDLVSAISDHETTLAQLGEAIARVKNDSVALIGLFNTNCGNWKDDCAKPYAATLEINNNTYADLIQKMMVQQKELDQLQSERTARQ